MGNHAMTAVGLRVRQRDDGREPPVAEAPEGPGPPRQPATRASQTALSGTDAAAAVGGMATAVINSCGIFERRDAALAARRPLSEIEVVGLFSNQKANADLYLEEVSHRLRARHPHLRFEFFRKFASEPANFSKQWLGRIHAVVSAFGD